MQLDRGDDEANRNESEERGAVLDQAEAAFPHQKPDDQRYWQCPPREADSSQYLQRETDSAQLSDEHQERDDGDSHEHNEEEGKPKSLAQRVHDGVLADCGKSPGHLDQENQANRAEE